MSAAASIHSDCTESLSLVQYWGLVVTCTAPWPQVLNVHHHVTLQVLYLTEPIDEVAIQNLADYDDKKFVDVSREGIDLGTDDQDTKKVGKAFCLSSCYFAY